MFSPATASICIIITERKSWQNIKGQVIGNTVNNSKCTWTQIRSLCNSHESADEELGFIGCKDPSQITNFQDGQELFWGFFFHSKTWTKPIMWYKCANYTRQKLKNSHMTKTKIRIVPKYTWSEEIFWYWNWIFLNLFVSSHSFIEPQTRFRDSLLSHIQGSHTKVQFKKAVEEYKENHIISSSTAIDKILGTFHQS